MGTYAVTGTASGMGRAVAEKLASAGHSVIDVDIKDASVIADLSTADGRSAGAQAVLARCGGTLDGAVLAAGLGPSPGPNQPGRITQVNYFGVVDLLKAWRHALAEAGAPKVVVFSSNSTTTTPAVPDGCVDALLRGDAQEALQSLDAFGPSSPSIAYAASKIAVSRWVRRNAVTSEWAGAGIRLNAIAPGAVLTPLLEKQLAAPAEAEAIKSFPIPTGGFGDAGHMAEWVIFMLSPAAEFLCGSIIFVDGGSDAYLRPDDWPRPVPTQAMSQYVNRFKSFRRPAGS